MSLNASLGGRRQAGFSMIEILIAVLILAVGLLGVSAMQMTSLKVNQGAYSRSQAAILANDILDRMRANRAAFLAGNYDDLDTGESIPSAQSCTGTDGCTRANIATQDFREWAGYFNDINDQGTNFVPLINGASGTVSRDGSNNATVTITWDQETWQANDDGDIEKSMVGQQYQVVVRI